MIEEMADQHDQRYLFAGRDVAGNATYAQIGRGRPSIAWVHTYRAAHADSSCYMTIELWTSRERYLAPVEPITAPADALMARVLDLLWTPAPEGHADTVRLLTEIQAAAHALDQHMLAGGRLPSRWIG
jgi:hypothetical protein